MVTTATKSKAQPEPEPEPTSESTARANAQGPSDGAVLGSFRAGMGFIEYTSLAAAEVPLKVLSTLGMPDAATNVARDSHTQMVHGIHGTLDFVASQTATLTGKGMSLLSGAVGSNKS